MAGIHADQLPMRFRILHFFAGAEQADLATLMDALREEYGHEGQFHPAVFEEHLMSLQAGGLLESRDVSFDARGGLVQTYAITALGRTRLNYLPAAWKA